MKIDFVTDRIIKKRRGFFHVIFSLISVFLLGILFVVADEDDYVYDDGYGYGGEEVEDILDKGVFGNTMFGKSILGNSVSNLRSYDITCNKGYISDGTKCVYAFEFHDIVYTGIINGDEVKIVLMDRNLGATTNDISDTGSYGYFYQWGNNYPFENTGDTTTTTQVSNIGTYSWQNPYYSSTFVKKSNGGWFVGTNKDLWGGSGDVVGNNYDNGEDKIRRQGPCPEGYYVPSLGDVYTLFELYFSNNGITGYDKFPSQVGKKAEADFTGFDTTLLLEEFNIPVAGFLDQNHTYKRSSGDMADSKKNTAALWSSTPSNIVGDSYDWEIHTTPAKKISIGGWPNYTSLGIPIRCFKEIIDCEENFHQEGWDCVTDTMTGYCLQTPGLHNGVYTGVDEVLNLEYTGGAWNTPVCEIICDQGYELTGENCELIILSCESGYHQEGTGCISNFGSGYCEQVQTIYHGYYTGTQDLFTIEWINGSRVAPECPIACDTGYELSGDICIGEALSIEFETYSGTKIDTIEGLNNGDDISNLRPAVDPKWKGHMFLGWYDENDELFRFSGTQLWDSITLYAKYAEFNDIVYTGIIDGNVVTVTLMDRNMGATATGVGMNAPVSSYGYYYQWGNNKGFLGVGETLNYTKISNVSGYGVGNWYYGEDFITIDGAWSTNFNFNLWGGSGDVLSNSYDNGNYRFNRQGPCPKGYHVPSLYEFHTLFALYFSNNSILDETGFPSTVSNESLADYFAGKSAIDGFMAEFNIPVAGRILGSYSYQRYGSDTSTKNVAHFWSSTPYNDGKNAFGAELQVGDKGKSISNSKINIGGWPAVTSAAYPVRCFKDYDDHTITWVNDDGTVLEVDDDVYEGETPIYYGQEPTKMEDASYTYEFSGWNIQPVAATQDAVYTAVYLSIPKTLYTVTWKNYDGTVIKVDTGVASGTIPEYSGLTPERPSEGIYAYVFSGWTPSITQVTGDQEYTAVYTRVTRRYDVTWRNIDGTVLEKDVNVGSGSMPQYNGSTPTNGASNQYVTSIFTGWNPALSPVVKNVEYMARYEYIVTSGLVLDTTRNPIHVTLNGNGGEFSNNSGTDVLDYDYYNRAEIEYSHSSNYSDDGIRSTHAVAADDREYPTTITGAEYLYINLTYDLHELGLGLNDDNKDKLYIHAGTSVNDQLVAQLSGNTNDGVQGNENYIITGESVLLDFYLVNRTITDVESNGFYAVIVGVIPVGYRMTGDVEVPIRDGYTFDGWYTQPEGGVVVDLTGGNISYSMEAFAHWIPNEYTINFDSSGGTNVPSQTVEYDSTVTLPGTTLTGYTFSGWYTQGGVFVGGSGATFTYDITQDLSLYATWIANTGTHYTVRHWLQNADDDLYTEVVSDRDTLTGTTDTQTQAVAKIYSGFTASGFSQTGIMGDESTVVDIYYDREIYTITIDLNGGTGVTSLTGRYGQTILAPVVTKENYEFKRWIPEFPSIMPLYGTSVRAIWGIADADISINIISISGNNFDLGSVKISNTSQMITGSLGENSFQLVDNKGEESGYIVTVSVSPLIGQINSINQIGASNVKLKSQGITTISGTSAEDIGIVSNVTSWSTAVDPITYLTRPDIVVLGDPMTGVYGDNLQLQVTIPAHTYPDQYLGTITYTLYN